MPAKLVRARLVNARSGQPIASEIELALTRAARRRGLLKRDALDRQAALVLSPCLAVHTAFMRFAIDVIFVNRSGHVTRVVRRLRPWRMAVSFRAYATIELAAGALDDCDISVGDRLYLSGTCADLDETRYAAVVSPPSSVSTSPVM